MAPFARSSSLTLTGFVYVARFPSAPLIDSRPPLINALALSRLSVSAPAGRIPAGNALLAKYNGGHQKSEPNRSMTPQHVYEVRPRKDRCGFDLMSDTLPFRLWYAEPSAVNNAVDYAEYRSRSHHAVIRVVMTLAT